MNNQLGISVIGFSAVSSLTSLLLADKGIEHPFHIQKRTTSFLENSPISNPIVNGPTGNLEKKYLAHHFNGQIPEIVNYKSISLTHQYKPYRITKGQYQTKTYAIDNRLRLQCFFDQLQHNPQIDLIPHHTLDNPISYAGVGVTIVGGGELFSPMFADMVDLPTEGFKTLREVFFLNLNGSPMVYAKYANQVTIYYVDGIGEILIYPFLHINNKHTINVTVNIIKGASWDVFSEVKTGQEAYFILVQLLKDCIEELALDIEGCDLVDDFFRIHQTKPYYKSAITLTDNKIFVGVGEAITKSDPLLGQGYNHGVDMAWELVKELSGCVHTNKAFVPQHSYVAYCTKMLQYMYHINRTITQGTDNRYLQKVYNRAAENTALCDFLFATYDDISLYFPWLINEEETQKLIDRFERQGMK